ncbi:unnamed protein product [Penicillium manginii]
MVQTNPTTADDTLHLPRILCLHGGGSNAAVFQSQCRRLIAQLKSEFRFVFAQAPFLSEAGPDVMSVYKEAKRQDDAKGATGAWVGLLGFSQGAKMCASILYRQQVRQEQLGRRSGDSEYDFGILIAGRAPFVCLDPHLDLHSPLPDVSQITDGKYEGPCPNVLRIPTVHVHGIRDPHVALHRQLFSDFSSAESRRFVEWDGGHRVPLKYNDVSLVAYQIRELAIQAGLR